MGFVCSHFLAEKLSFPMGNLSWPTKLWDLVGWMAWVMVEG